MPARARDVIRALEQLGIIFKKPSSGSHWKARKGEISYTIALHNGIKSMISDVYIRGVCRAFGVDEGELRKLL